MSTKDIDLYNKKISNNTEARVKSNAIDTHTNKTSKRNKRTETNRSSDTVRQSDKEKNDKLFKRILIPIVGNFEIQTQYRIMSLLGLFSLILFITSVYLTNVAKENKAIVHNTANSLESKIQKYNNSILEAYQGKDKSYNDAKNTWEDVIAELNNLEDSTDNKSGELIKSQIKDLINNIQLNVNSINENKDYLENNINLLQKINSDTNKAKQLSEHLISTYTKDKIDYLYAKNILLYISNINSNIEYITIYPTTNTNLFNELNENKNLYKNLLIDLYKGNDKFGLLPVNALQYKGYNEIANIWPTLDSEITYLLNNQQKIINITNAYNDNKSKMKNLYNLLVTFKEKNSVYENYRIALGNMCIALFFIISVVSIILLFYIYNSEQDKQQNIEEQENIRNEKSIFKLLNEMIPLQDGDLTKKTTVTEEITGAIADSINATIDSLSSLVKKIKNTSNAMKEKTDNVKVISEDMLKITIEQSESIIGTNESVNKISKAISEISKKTEESTIIAEESVLVSNEGVQQVLDSISSMEEIKKNMNETVLLMNKVNNSSKQISEIVELLSEITEDTSVLSLNATVQAAKAGESGDGFKIVADAIQKLAEDAGDAAKKVGNLIGNVQTDINAVEMAVNKTTNEVKKGVELSEKTRESINKMSEVSSKLAKVVKDISEDAKENQKISNEISENMSEVLIKIEDNKKSTEKTNMSITEISELSDSLGYSVQSFTIK